MLKSIFKFAIFLAIVGAIAFGAHFLLTAPEGDGVIITFRGTQQAITPFIFVSALVLAYVGLFLLLKVSGLLLGLVNFILGNDSAFTRWFQRADERRGAEALSQAHAALATGDIRKARQRALVAERKLKRPELTRLINAQAAELAGDVSKAKTYYRALADRTDSALVGVKGLLRIAENEGDRETALLLAKTAANLKTEDKETLDLLYTLQSHEYDWEGARQTLAQMKRHNLIDGAEAQRCESMLALAQAAEKEDGGQTGEALKMAVDAAKIDPTNVDALSKATRHLVETGATRQAGRLVLEAWKAGPSPKIAQVYADLVPDETPDDRRQRFEELFQSNPSHPQTLYTRAELALRQKRFQDAREALNKLNETEPSGRYCAIRAAVALGESKPESEVRTWLIRGIGAPGAAEGMITDPTLLPFLIGAGEARAMANGTVETTAPAAVSTAPKSEEDKDPKGAVSPA
ncbi:MAG: heme biosynthesis HemY N-terminal domain-containing protein [Pseudomonadota bacterium]